MLSTIKTVALSCFTVSLIASLTNAAAIPSSQVQKRQSCYNEPNDPNCDLPLWVDTTTDLTFDDMKAGQTIPDSYHYLQFTNFTVASPDTSAPHFVNTKSGSNYLRVHASETAFIQPVFDDYNQYNQQMAFIKILNLNFGCSHQSSSSRKERPMNCTLTLAADCAAPSGPLYDIVTYTEKYNYTVSGNASTSDLKYIDMGTNGIPYKCFNYTMSVAGPKGGAAVLFLDDISVVEYFWSGLGG